MKHYFIKIYYIKRRIYIMNSNNKQKNVAISKYGNILNTQNTKKAIADVLDYIASVVSNTLGPYGHNALYQSASNISSTKDGWTVAQNIKFNNILYSAIRDLILSAPENVVLSAGDGTTTVLVAANALNKIIEDIIPKYTLIQEFEKEIQEVFSDIIKVMYDNSIIVTNDNMHDIIYNIALVSSNGDDELAKSIRDIIEHTKNPYIKIDPFGCEHTHVEYIDGYQLSGALQFPEYYVNKKHNICTLQRPHLLIFGFPLPIRYAQSLIKLSEWLGEKENLLIIAPDYEKLALDCIQNFLLKTNKNNIILFRTNVKYSIDRECMDDFSALTHGYIIPPNYSDFEEFMKDVADVDITKDELAGDKINSMLAFLSEQLCGTCERVVVSDNGLIANGVDTESEFVKAKVALLEKKIKESTAEYTSRLYILDTLRQAKIRLGKLRCKIGVLHIGATGVNFKTKADAVDDAIRACELAFNGRVTIGSGLSVIKACRILKEKKIGKKSFDNNYCKILFAIEKAFEQLFATLIHNRERTFDKSDMSTTVYQKSKKIIEKCIFENCGFDIRYFSFDHNLKIINPVDVDISILKACMRLLLVCQTSDQLLYQFFEGFTLPNNIDDDNQIPSINEVLPHDDYNESYSLWF